MAENNDDTTSFKGHKIAGDAMVEGTDPSEASALCISVPFSSTLAGLPLIPSFLMSARAVTGTKRLAIDAFQDNPPCKKTKTSSFFSWGTNKSYSNLRTYISSNSADCSSTEDDIATLVEEPQQQESLAVVEKLQQQQQHHIAPTARPAIQLLNLPEDLIDHCIAFLDPAEDRYSISLTCRKFTQMINANRTLRLTDLFGCPSTGKRCIILETDSKESALNRIQPFLDAGSTDAMYLAGMIKCYCDEEVEAGIGLLRQGAEYERLECMYSLGIIFRDVDKDESKRILVRAHELGCLPATLEVLPAMQVRKLHGDLTADELRLHLGPTPLGKILRRYFVDCSTTRVSSTSHCWNPACGRWGYKNAHTSATDDNDTITAHLAQTTPLATLTPPFKMKCARMKVCSSCRRAKYCSKLCQVYDWRSERHKAECQFLR